MTAKRTKERQIMKWKVNHRWKADQMIRDIHAWVCAARMMDHENDHGRMGGGFSWPWYVSGIDTRNIRVS